MTSKAWQTMSPLSCWIREMSKESKNSKPSGNRCRWSKSQHHARADDETALVTTTNGAQSWQILEPVIGP